MVTSRACVRVAALLVAATLTVACQSRSEPEPSTTMGRPLLGQRVLELDERHIEAWNQSCPDWDIDGVVVGNLGGVRTGDEGYLAQLTLCPFGFEIIREDLELVSFVDVTDRGEILLIASAVGESIDPLAYRLNVSAVTLVSDDLPPPIYKVRAGVDDMPMLVVPGPVGDRDWLISPQDVTRPLLETDGTCCLAMDAAGPHLAAIVSSDGTESRLVFLAPEFHEHLLPWRGNSLAVCPDGQAVVSSREGPEYSIFRLAEGIVTTGQGPDRTVPVACSPDGSRVLATTFFDDDRRTLGLINMTSGEYNDLGPSPFGAIWDGAWLKAPLDLARLRTAPLLVP